MKKCIGVIAVLMMWAVGSQAAGVSGRISASPSNTSATGWTLGSGDFACPAYSVRIMGAEPVAAFTATGTYSLADVPTGSVHLVLDEPSGYDAFTHSSRVIPVEVTPSGVAGADFTVDWKWNEITYHENWGQTGYGEWVPQFLSEQVGFICHRVRGEGIDPERVELYRTMNGGANWAMIGSWIISTNYPRAALDCNFYFADASHGVLFATANEGPFGGGSGRGFFYTSDGGETWSYTALPRPPNCYGIKAPIYTKISDTHWIAAADIGGGVQGYSSDTYTVLWETLDSGADWSLAWTNSQLACTALKALPSGLGMAFCTPYFAGNRVLFRSENGDWTFTNNFMMDEVNSGYGAADIAMSGNKTWVGGTLNGTSGFFVAESDFTGWRRLGPTKYSYYDFCDERRGFILHGTTFTTYDGGSNAWAQAAGSGLCCHGDHIWAFAPEEAMLHVNGKLLRYDEPAATLFEIYPILYASASTNPTAVPARGQPLGAFRAKNWGTTTIRLSNITWRASGTLDDASDVGPVRLIHDLNRNGVVDASDAVLSSGTFASDNGTLKTDLDILLHPWVDEYFIVTADVLAGSPGTTVQLRFERQDVVVARTDTWAGVYPEMPTGYAARTSTLEAQQTLFSEDFEGAASRWDFETAYTNNRWRLSAEAYCSSNQSAYLAGWWEYGERRYLTLTTEVVVTGGQLPVLCFNHNYRFDYNQGYTMNGYVEISVNGGSWNSVKSYYPTGVSLVNTGMVYEAIPLTGLPVTGGSVRIRFQVRQSQGWGSLSWWRIDNVLLANRPRLISNPGKGGATTTSYHAPGASVTVAVPPTVATNYNYICYGWTGTGSAPANGNTHTVTFSIWSNSSLTWLYGFVPVIRYQPVSNIWIRETKYDDVSVTVTSVPDCAYQWYFEGAPIATNANQDYYYIGPMSSSATGRYYAVMTNILGATTSDVVVASMVSTVSLARAVGATGLVWTTGGHQPWVGWNDPNYSHETGYVAESGDIGNSESSWVTTVLEGPQSVRFWWRVHSQSSYDMLTLSVNAQTSQVISGYGNWQCVTSVVPDGVSTLRWEYVKNSSLSYYEDCGWLTEFTYRYPAPPTSVAFTRQTNGVQLVWPGMPYSTGYQVWKATNSSFTAASLLTATTGTVYLDTQVVLGETYYYWLCATNTDFASPVSSTAVFRYNEGGAMPYLYYLLMLDR